MTSLNCWLTLCGGLLESVAVTVKVLLP